MSFPVALEVSTAFLLHNAVEGRASLATLAAIMEEDEEAISRIDENANLPLHYWSSYLDKRVEECLDDSLIDAVLKLLLEAYPAAAEIVDYSGNLCIHDASRCGASLASLRLLCEASAHSLSVKDSEGDLPFHLALQHQASLEILELLYATSPDASCSTKSEYRNSLLAYALKVGAKEEVIAWLLGEKASREEQQRDWRCDLPIHVAFKYRASTTSILLLLAANPLGAAEADADGNLPIHLACERGYPVPVVQELLAHEPSSVRVQDLFGHLPLHLACLNSASEETIDALLHAFPAATMAKSEERSLPLHYAVARCAQNQIVESLLRTYPAAASIKDGKGWLPIHIAAASVDTDPKTIIALLRCYPLGASTTLQHDGALPLHIAAKRRAGLGIVRALLAVYPAAAGIRDSRGMVPFRCALNPQGKTHGNDTTTTTPLDVLVELLKEHPVDFHAHHMDLSSLKASDRPILKALMVALKSRSRFSTVHLHLCGHSFAGKTTTKNALVRALGRSWMAYHISGMLVGNKTAEATRTVGMEVFNIDRGYKRYILHDYGGHTEFHVNHARFLAAPGSIYVIVVALWDPISSTILSDSDILDRYRYWLRFVYSVGDAVPNVITIINFRSLAEAADPGSEKREGILPRVWRLLTLEHQAWTSSQLLFIGMPLFIDVINTDQVFRHMNSLVQQATSSMDVNYFPMSDCIDEAMRCKLQWPKAVTELQLRHELIIPMLRSLPSLAEYNLEPDTEQIAQEQQQQDASAAVGDSNVAMNEQGRERLLSILCDIIIERLCLLGEIVIVQGREGIAWAVTDSNWLCGSVLGRIFCPSDLVQTPPPPTSSFSPSLTATTTITTPFRQLKSHSSPLLISATPRSSEDASYSMDSASPVLSLSAAASKGKAYGEHLLSFKSIRDRAGNDSCASYADLLPALLEAIGVCIPVHTLPLAVEQSATTNASSSSFLQSGEDATEDPGSFYSVSHEEKKFWFPSFIDSFKTDSDCTLMSGANRIMSRRFILLDPARQVFPPGYFTSLFVAVAGLERASQCIKVFSDGLEVIANYSYTPEGTKGAAGRSAGGGGGGVSTLPIKNKIQIIITRNTDSFDVTVCGGPHVSSRDSRVWDRMQSIRSLVYPSGDYHWQRNVQLSEFCLHPSGLSSAISVPDVLAGLEANKAAAASSFSSRAGVNELHEEMLSYFFGELDGVAHQECAVSPSAYRFWSRGAKAYEHHFLSSMNGSESPCSNNMGSGQGNARLSFEEQEYMRKREAEEEEDLLRKAKLHCLSIKQIFISQMTMLDQVEKLVSSCSSAAEDALIAVEQESSASKEILEDLSYMKTLLPPLNKEATIESSSSSSSAVDADEIENLAKLEQMHKGLAKVRAHIANSSDSSSAVKVSMQILQQNAARCASEVTAVQRAWDKLVEELGDAIVSFSAAGEGEPCFTDGEVGGGSGGGGGELVQQQFQLVEAEFGRTVSFLPSGLCLDHLGGLQYVFERALAARDARLTCALMDEMRSVQGTLTEVFLDTQAIRKEVHSVVLETKRMTTSLTAIIQHVIDMPAFPLIIVPPAKGLDWLNPRTWAFKKFRLFFVCPITLVVAKSGPKGKGYKIFEPRGWFIKAIPILKISLILLNIALKVGGVPISIPLPDIDPSVYFTSALAAMDEALRLEGIGAEGGGGLGIGDSQLTAQARAGGAAVSDAMQTVEEVLSREGGSLLRTELDMAIDALGSAEQFNEQQGQDVHTAHEVASDVKKDVLASASQIARLADLADASFAALQHMLQNSGDPMPNNRPLYSGLVGPIVSRGDGSTAWVDSSAVKQFEDEGRKAFAFDHLEI